MTTLTLWDLDDANLIGTYPSEDAALDVVHYSVQAHGRGSMLTVGLGRDGVSGQTVAVAEGASLIELAERRAPTAVETDSPETLPETLTDVGSSRRRAPRRSG